MTRSKIFAGAAAVVLTGAAAIASANNNHRATGWYQTAVNFHSVTISGVCPVGQATCQQTITINGVPTLKQLYNSASLAHPLQRQSF